MRKPINWYGGKAKMAKQIVSFYPEHKTYVEVFGGGASCLFEKAPGKVDVYNDIDGDLVNFFRCLRDKFDELQRVLTLTPYARSEFDECKKDISTGDDVERARRFYVQCMQSFSCCRASFAISKNTSRRGMSSNVSAWLSQVDSDLCQCVERLRTVQVENMDFEAIIKRYDGINTFFYLDPPYVPDTRVSKSIYAHEMNDLDHKRLVDILNGIQGKYLLSGYDNGIYNGLNARKTILGEFSTNAAKTQGDTRSRRIEYIWHNYELKWV